MYFCHICLHTSSLWGDDLGEAGRKHDESNRIADPAQVLQEPITVQSAIYPLLSCGHTNHTNQAQCVKPSSQIYSAVTDLYNKTGTGRSRLVSLSESIKHAAGEMCLNFSTCEIWHFWWISKVQVSNFNFLVCTVCLLIFPPPWSPLLSLLTYFFTPNFFFPFYTVKYLFHSCLLYLLVFIPWRTFNTQKRVTELDLLFWIKHTGNFLKLSSNNTVRKIEFSLLNIDYHTRFYSRTIVCISVNFVGYESNVDRKQWFFSLAVLVGLPCSLAFASFVYIFM